MPAVGSLRLLQLDFQNVPCGVQFNDLHAYKLETSKVCLICTQTCGCNPENAKPALSVKVMLTVPLRQKWASQSLLAGSSSTSSAVRKHKIPSRALLVRVYEVIAFIGGYCSA